MIEYSDQQYISRDDLYDKGFSQYKIKKLVDDGKLVVINRRFFENPDYDGDINEFYSVNAYAPKGVICLISAAVYHNLTTSRPLRIDVALPRRSRIPDSPDWPRMQYYLFSGERYSTGIETVAEGENKYSIYDREKTVCDILFYRNKLGFEPAADVLRNYLEKQDRDINRLMKYAECLRCGNLLRGYMEVLI